MEAEAYAAFNVGLDQTITPLRAAEAYSAFNVGLALPVPLREAEALSAFNIVQWFSSGAAIIIR